MGARGSTRLLSRGRAVAAWAAAAVLGGGPAVPIPGWLAPETRPLGVAWAQPAADAWPMAGGDPSHAGTARGPAPPYREAWSVEGLAPVAAVIVAADAVLVVGTRQVASLEPATGAERWRVDRAQGPAGPAAVSGSLVVFAEGRGDGAAIVAARLEDGERVWSRTIGSPVNGGLTVDDDRVYAGSVSGRTVALDAETGEVAWEFRATGRVDTAPAVADGSVYVAAEDFSTGVATLYALDARTGDERWRFSPPDAAVGVSSVTLADDLVLWGAGDLRVRGFDPATGMERWAERTRGAFAAPWVPAGAEAIVGDRGGYLYRLRPATGRLEWIFRVPGGFLQGSPVVLGDAVVVGDASGQASAVELSSGLLVWRMDFGDGQLSGGAADGERIYLAEVGERGRVIALERDPGGSLLAEPSPTTLFIGRALVGFAAAAIAVGGVLFLVVGVGLARWRAGRGSAPTRRAPGQRGDRNGGGAPRS